MNTSYIDNTKNTQELSGDEESWKKAGWDELLDSLEEEEGDEEE